MILVGKGELIQAREVCRIEVDEVEPKNDDLKSKGGVVPVQSYVGNSLDFHFLR